MYQTHRVSSVWHYYELSYFHFFFLPAQCAFCENPFGLEQFMLFLYFLLQPSTLYGYAIMEWYPILDLPLACRWYFFRILSTSGCTYFVASTSLIFMLQVSQ